MIKLLLVLLTPILFDSPDSLEQKACDYFFDNIFGENYHDFKIIEFQNQTDTSKYCGIVHQCQNWDQKTSGQMMSTNPSKTVYVIANTTALRVRRIKRSSGRLKVYVYSSIKVGDNYYVSIRTYKKLHFVEYYFIKFDTDGNIIETCKAGEII